MKLAKNQKLFLALLIAGGTVAQSLTMARSGLTYDFGLGFWGPNGHDGVWHLALANQAFRGFPLPHPNFSGAVLANYHLFFDYLLALTSKLSGLSGSFLYFQVFPIIFSFSLGWLSFLVGYCWRKDYWTGFWLAFFNYFAGSFGFLVTLWRGEGIGGESIFWSMQSISTLINPPFALSLLVLLGAMLLLLSLKKRQLRKIIIISLLVGLLISIKSYAAIIAFAGLFAFIIFKFFRKEKDYLPILPLSLFISLILFLVNARTSSNLFVWRPFWFINSMMESRDRLYLPSIALARVNSLAPKPLIIELAGIFIFLIGNLGTRVFGFFDLRRRLKNLTAFDFFLLGGGLVAFSIPLLFVQKGTAWNTIQFFYYFLFFANFYAAGFFSRLIQSKKSFSRAGLILLVLLTIPTTVSSLKGYLGWPPPASLPKAELEALEYLKQQPQGVVLTFPYSSFEKAAYKTTPLPLRVYAPTAYVSAFSGKQTFLEETNLDILGYDWEERKENIFDFFSATDSQEAKEFLAINNIRYIYLVKDAKVNWRKDLVGAKLIFENSRAEIFEPEL